MGEVSCIPIHMQPYQCMKGVLEKFKIILQLLNAHLKGQNV